MGGGEGAARPGLHGRQDRGLPETPAALRHLSNREPDVEVVESPADWLRNGEEEPTKLVIVDRPDKVPSWLKEAQHTFSGRLHVTRSLPHYVEVGGLEGTKASALEFLCELWGINPARTLAFGDADNDIDMLEFAGLGVAVGGWTKRSGPRPTRWRPRLTRMGSLRLSAASSRRRNTRCPSCRR